MKIQLDSRLGMYPIAYIMILTNSIDDLSRRLFRVVSYGYCKIQRREGSDF